MTTEMEKYNATKYGKLYLKITRKANNEDRRKLKKDNPLYIYYESHHILPKSLYPEYKNLKEYPSNRVLLIAREHFICHILLMKHYKKINNKNAYIKMSRALDILSKDGKHNSKIYESLKLNLSHTEETKLKISESQKGVPRSEETKLKISESLKKITWSKELIHNNKKHMDKLNNMKATCPHCGIICDLGNASKHHFDNCHKVKNPELSTCPYCNFKGEYRFIKPWHFDKCKKKPGFIKNKIHKIITCPHCNKEGGIGNMKRYHFDNCKNKKEIW